VGDGAAGTASYQLYGTTNGGVHWLGNGPAHLLPTGLAAVSDSGKGVLLVAAESGASRLYRSTNDGTTLPVVFDAGGGGTVWSDAGFTTSTQALAVLLNTAMYLSRDSAATWVKVVF
jgi:thiazole synthase ThiGH ThiG subunit